MYRTENGNFARAIIQVFVIVVKSKVDHDSQSLFNFSIIQFFLDYFEIHQQQSLYGNYQYSIAYLAEISCYPTYHDKEEKNKAGKL